ncbi:MAG: hypothetical protein ACO1QS_16380 [Verrucomicrobiota bacterium]
MHLFKFITRVCLAILAGAAIGFLVNMVIILIGLIFESGHFPAIAMVIAIPATLLSAIVTFLWLVDRAWEQYLKERIKAAETQPP